MNTIAFYDNKPMTLEAVNNGSYMYRWNIAEVQNDNDLMSGVSENKTYQCEEVLVWEPITSNKITEAVITSKWDKNYEQKLVNEYNAAMLGLYGDMKSEDAQSHIDAYLKYLKERDALKKQVDSDCKTLNIK